MGAVTAVIPHWYEDRYPVLCEAIEALHSGTVVPARVIVWDNTNRLPALAGVDVIRSSVNVGPPARFLAAMLVVGTPWIWFQDNDVVVQPKTLENAVTWAQRCFSLGVFTLEGRTKVTGKPYKHWPKVYGRGLGTLNTPAPMPVTISLGRGELVSSHLVQASIGELPWGADWRMDDIFWSHVIEGRNIPRYVIPTVAGDSDLTERKVRGTGMCHEPGFYDERDQLVQQLWGD